MSPRTRGPRISRGAIGFGLLAFWLLMMGLLLYRERGTRFSSPGLPPAAQQTTPRSPRETWLGLFVAERRVRSQVWIDGEGGVLQIVTPFGLTLRRGGPEVIFERVEKEAVVSVPSALEVLEIR